MTETPEPTHGMNVEAEVQAAFSETSASARRLILEVLEIERRNLNLSRPRVQPEIERAVKKIVGAAESP